MNTTGRLRRTGFSAWRRTDFVWDRTHVWLVPRSESLIITFNVQIQPDLRSPLVQINLRNNGITFSGVGMLDSGCTTCIIPFLAYLKMQEDTCPKPTSESKESEGTSLFWASSPATLPWWRYFSRFLQRRHTDHDIRHSHLDRPEHTRPHTLLSYYYR